MIISLPFLILGTLPLYHFVPELKIFNGRCLKRYLIILSVAYFLTFFITTGDIELRLCEFCGCTMYYSYLSAFLWLNVISYDLCSRVMLVFPGFWGVWFIYSNKTCQFFYLKFQAPHIFVYHRNESIKTVFIVRVGPTTPCNFYDNFNARYGAKW